MNTGENAEALRKIIDLTRKCSIVLLCLHYYVYCYGAFEVWHLTHPALQRILMSFGNAGLFNHFYISKAAALGLLVISLMGSKGKKDEKLKLAVALRYLISGLLVYWSSRWLLWLNAEITILAGLYISVTTIGFLLILRGGNLCSRIIHDKLHNDIFNKLQETFP